MRQRRKQIVAIVLGATLLLGSSLAAAADEAIPDASELPEAGGPAREGEEAMLFTAENLASSKGISVDLALDVFAHQEATDKLQEEIYNVDPENYGGAVHEELPRIGTTIYVKGPVPEAASRVVDGHENVAIETTEFSLAEWESMANSATEALKQLGIEDYGVGADMRTRSIVVEVSASELQDLGLNSDDLLRRFSAATPIRLTTVDGPVSILDHSYGGGTLQDGSVFECTSGFVVEKISNGVDGVLTAEHCSGLDAYKETSGFVYNMDYQGAALKSLGDAEWHTTDHTEYDDFYVTNSSRNDVSGLKQHLWMDVGDTVCRYGRKTGNGGCVQINQLFVSKSGYSSLIRTDPTSPSAAGGDSGGPWYVGGTAWGLHHGRFGSNNDHAFTAVSIVDGNMGVQLRTT